VATPGGLYRYDLGDRVRVRGFVKSAPMLEPTGRVGIVGDLAGEKLAEAFVGQCLPAAKGFSLLLAASRERRYRLVLDARHHDEPSARILAAKTETALTRHWLYADRRALGYLGPVALLRVSRPGQVIDRLFLAQGLRADGGKSLALAPFPRGKKPSWLPAGPNWSQ
jgi:hypothetical protein